MSWFGSPLNHTIKCGSSIIFIIHVVRKSTWHRSSGCSTHQPYSSPLYKNHIPIYEYDHDRSCTIRPWSGRTSYINAVYPFLDDKWEILWLRGGWIAWEKTRTCFKTLEGVIWRVACRHGDGLVFSCVVHTTWTRKFSLGALCNIFFWTTFKRIINF